MEVQQREGQALFPWIKNVVDSFSQSLMVDYDIDILSFLHGNIDKEIQFIHSSNEYTVARTKTLYNELTQLYGHMRLKISQHSDFTNATLSCVRLLSQIIQTGLILTQGLLNSEWIARLLTAIKLLPGRAGLMYEALLLVNGLKKIHYKPYGSILKYLLIEDFQDHITDPLTYMEVILLFRRLKALIPKKHKKNYNVLAARIKPPSNLISWLTSLDVDESSPLRNLQYKKIASQLMKKDLPESFISVIRALALDAYYFESSGEEFKARETEEEPLDLFVIDSSSSKKCNNKNRKTKASKLGISNKVNSLAKRKRKKSSLNVKKQNKKSTVNSDALESDSDGHIPKVLLSNSNDSLLMPKKTRKSKSQLHHTPSAPAHQSNESKKGTFLQSENVSDRDSLFEESDGIISKQSKNSYSIASTSNTVPKRSCSEDTDAAKDVNKDITKAKSRKKLKVSMKSKKDAVGEIPKTKKEKKTKLLMKSKKGKTDKVVSNDNIKFANVPYYSMTSETLDNEIYIDDDGDDDVVIIETCKPETKSVEPGLESEVSDSKGMYLKQLMLQKVTSVVETPSGHSNKKELSSDSSVNLEEGKFTCVVETPSGHSNEKELSSDSSVIFEENKITSVVEMSSGHSNEKELNSDSSVIAEEIKNENKKEEKSSNKITSVTSDSVLDSDGSKYDAAQSLLKFSSKIVEKDIPTSEVFTNSLLINLHKDNETEPVQSKTSTKMIDTSSKCFHCDETEEKSNASYESYPVNDDRLNSVQVTESSIPEKLSSKTELIEGKNETDSKISHQYPHPSYENTGEDAKESPVPSDVLHNNEEQGKDLDSTEASNVDCQNENDFSVNNPVSSVNNLDIQNSDAILVSVESQCDNNSPLTIIKSSPLQQTIHVSSVVKELEVDKSESFKDKIASRVQHQMDNEQLAAHMCESDLGTYESKNKDSKEDPLPKTTDIKKSIKDVSSEISSTTHENLINKDISVVGASHSNEFKLLSNISASSTADDNKHSVNDDPPKVVILEKSAENNSMEITDNFQETLTKEDLSVEVAPKCSESIINASITIDNNDYLLNSNTSKTTDIEKSIEDVSSEVPIRTRENLTKKDVSVVVTSDSNEFKLPSTTNAPSTVDDDKHSLTDNPVILKRSIEDNSMEKAESFHENLTNEDLSVQVAHKCDEPIISTSITVDNKDHSQNSNPVKTTDIQQSVVVTSDLNEINLPSTINVLSNVDVNKHSLNDDPPNTVILEKSLQDNSMEITDSFQENLINENSSVEIRPKCDEPIISASITIDDNQHLQNSETIKTTDTEKSLENSSREMSDETHENLTDKNLSVEIVSKCDKFKLLPTINTSVGVGDSETDNPTKPTECNTSKTVSISFEVQAVDSQNLNELDSSSATNTSPTKNIKIACKNDDSEQNLLASNASEKTDDCNKHLHQSVKTKSGASNISCSENVPTSDDSQSLTHKNDSPSELTSELISCKKLTETKVSEVSKNNEDIISEDLCAVKSHESCATENNSVNDKELVSETVMQNKVVSEMDKTDVLVNASSNNINKRNNDVVCNDSFNTSPATSDALNLSCSSANNSPTLNFPEYSSESNKSNTEVASDSIINEKNNYFPVPKIVAVYGSAGEVDLNCNKMCGGESPSKRTSEISLAEPVTVFCQNNEFVSFSDISLKNKSISVNSDLKSPVAINFSSAASSEIFCLYRPGDLLYYGEKTDAAKDEILSTCMTDETMQQSLSSGCSTADSDYKHNSSEDEENLDDIDNVTKNVDDPLQMKDLSTSVEDKTDLKELECNENISDEKESTTVLRQSLRLRNKIEIKDKRNSKDDSEANVSATQNSLVNESKSSLDVIEECSPKKTESAQGFNTTNSAVYNLLDGTKTPTSKKTVSSQRSMRKNLSSVIKSKESSVDSNTPSKSYSLRRSKSKRLKDDSENLGIDLNKLQLDTPSSRSTRSKKESKFVKLLTSDPHSQNSDSSNLITKRETRSSKSDKEASENAPNYNLRNRKSIIAPAKLKI